MLAHKRLIELLEYDSATGVFRWRLSPRHNVPAGAVAGCKNARGYSLVRVDGVLYRAHRLAWFYVSGEWPTGDVDHINGQRDDNRFSNLRVVSSAMNSQNRRRANRNSRSGLLGAFFDPTSRQFRAHIRVGGKSQYLGEFPTAEAAHTAYLEAKRQSHPGNTL